MIVRRDMDKILWTKILKEGNFPGRMKVSNICFENK